MISQVVKNQHAELAAKSLGMLCGVMTGNLMTKANTPLCAAMKIMLTPPIAKMFRNSNSQEFLRTINMNVEIPVCIWDVDMRSELTAFLTKWKQMD